MNKHILLFVFVFLSFYSCNLDKQKDNTIREQVDVEIIVDGLMTSMPAEMLVYEHELVWYDMNPDSFIHIVDKKTGNTIAEIGQLGEGPDEFYTPFISWHSERSILISDCFANRQMILLLDSVKMKALPHNLGVSTSLLGIAENQYVWVNMQNDLPFVFWNGGKEITFGKYPLGDVEKIINKQEVFQGVISYNHYNKSLIYSVPDLSYISLYRLDDGMFNQIWEKTLPGLESQLMDNGALIINKTTHYTPSAITLTKDYIVTIERDEKTREISIESDSSDRLKRNFARTPQTLFVYDYDFNLKKILHTQIPMFRLASDGGDNEVFFIGLKGEFCIAKCDLDL